MDSPSKRLTRQLRKWWPLYIEAVGSGYCCTDSSPVFGDAIDERDCDSFLRGLNTLYWIDRGYIIQTEMMPRRRDGTLRRHVLFEKVGQRCRIRDETIVHFAAATELIQDYGWPKERVVWSPQAEARLHRGRWTSWC